MASQTNKARPALARRARQLAVRLIVGGARRRVRLVVLFFFTVLLLQLLYATVWWELHQEVPLPAALTTETAGTTESLTSIADQRQKRIERAPRTFAPLAPLFVPAVRQ